MAKTYKCELQYGADGVATGYMMLTRTEYLTAKKVINRDNWKELSDEGWSGNLTIWCDELEKGQV